MNYSAIKYCDIANGIGVRTVLFVSGCRNHCKGCFQPETWDFEFGNPFDRQVEDEIIASLAPDYIKGLTLLGGDPLEPENQDKAAVIFEEGKRSVPEKRYLGVHGLSLHTDLSEGGKCYTKNTAEFLSMIDILVDGPYVDELRDITLKFKGSKNQRVIDCAHYSKTGRL